MYWRTWFQIRLTSVKQKSPDRGIRELAREMGISAAHLHAILNQGSRPSEETFYRILVRLEIPETESARLGLSLLMDGVVNPALHELLRKLEDSFDECS